MEMENFREGRKEGSKQGILAYLFVSASKRIVVCWEEQGRKRLYTFDVCSTTTVNSALILLIEGRIVVKRNIKKSELTPDISAYSQDFMEEWVITTC
jgi:hypothetical protein